MRAAGDEHNVSPGCEELGSQAPTNGTRAVDDVPHATQYKARDDAVEYPIMEQPHIQYAKTSDGVNIAFWSIGEGLPVIMTAAIPWGNLESEWRYPAFRSWYENNARGRRLIRYDNRGSGLSDRNVARMDRESFELDILAVANRLELDTFALVGVSPGAPVAIGLAARNPGRVSHLILWCPVWRPADWATPQQAAMRGLLSTDWALFTETTSHAVVAGWGSSDEARQYAALMRDAIDPHILIEAGILDWRYDLASLLPEILCPTLVLQRREATTPTLDSARQLAASIPDCQLVVLEGGALLPWVGDSGAVTRAISDFLGIEEDLTTARQDPGQPVGAVHTILFTDVEGSTALTQRLGDAAAREVLREHERITREALRAHGGSEVKTMGDGFMASFGSATKALECAIAIQRAIEGTRQAEIGDREAIRVRIGLNAGEPIAEDDPDGRGDLHGTAVITAARIAALASGGEILVSNVVRELVAGKGFLFSDRGDHALKGFEDPVRVYEVRWAEGGPS